MEEVVGGRLKVGSAGKTGNASDGVCPGPGICGGCGEEVVQFRNLPGRIFYHCIKCGFTRNNYDDLAIMGDTVEDQIHWREKHPGQTPVLFDDQWIKTGRADRIN